MPTLSTSDWAKDILLQLGICEKKINLFDVPMNKDRSLAKDSYNKITISIAEGYKSDQKIAVTAEGDAGFYSTIYYISENLQKQDIPVARIAGVPAFIASGTLANIHIVKQEEELNIIPGIISLDDIKSKLELGNSIVVMKASQCEEVIKNAINLFEDATFHYFENVGIASKEYYTADRVEILNRKFPYFSLIIIQKTI